MILHSGEIRDSIAKPHTHTQNIWKRANLWFRAFGEDFNGSLLRVASMYIRLCLGRCKPMFQRVPLKRVCLCVLERFWNPALAACSTLVFWVHFACRRRRCCYCCCCAFICQRDKSRLQWIGFVADSGFFLKAGFCNRGFYP